MGGIPGTDARSKWLRRRVPFDDPLLKSELAIIAPSLFLFLLFLVIIAKQQIPSFFRPSIRLFSVPIIQSFLFRFIAPPGEFPTIQSAAVFEWVPLCAGRACVAKSKSCVCVVHTLSLMTAQ